MNGCRPACIVSITIIRAKQNLGLPIFSCFYRLRVTTTDYIPYRQGQSFQIRKPWSLIQPTNQCNANQSCNEFDGRGTKEIDKYKLMSKNT